MSTNLPLLLLKLKKLGAALAITALLSAKTIFLAIIKYFTKQPVASGLHCYTSDSGVLTN